jgi:death-on-curing protein
VEFYPEFVDKAAVLVVHIARNHPLPDGNKRLAWVALTMFCALNGRHLTVAADDAVAFMLAIASGEKNEGDVAVWLAERIETSNDEFRQCYGRSRGSPGRAEDAIH